MRSSRRIPPHWEPFLAAVRRLRESPADDVSLADVAQVLGWPYKDVQLVAADMTERRIIETDMGLGQLPTIIEAR